MSASVRIEDEAFSDERYEDLASVAGLADADHARGKMARLWRQCTLEQTHFLPLALVTRILGPNAIAALEAARLGEKVGDDKVRIRGTKGRIEWLKRLRENGKFGKRGAEFGKRGGRPRKNPLQGVTQNPPPAPAPAPVLIREEGSPALAVVPAEKRATRILVKAHPEQQAVIDGFHERFKQAYGTKPTWGPKSVGMIGSLLKRHSADELFARMDFMFGGRAKWPPPPYSLDVFVKHIDRWVEDQQTTLVAFRRVKEIE